MLRIRRLALALAAAALLLPAALRAAEYIIYTKDGARIVAREKPVLQGKRLLFKTPLGAPQSMALDDFDAERTAKANQEGLGGAYVLGEGPDTKVIPAPTDKKPSLSDYIKQNRKIMKPPAPAESPAEGGNDSGAAVNRGSLVPKGGDVGGLIDLQMMNSFVQAFEGAGIRGVRLVAVPRGVRLQVITETEQQVFGAIGAAARGLKESRALGKPLEKVDMYLATSAGENAGRFEISPEDAEGLVTGRTTPSKFFVKSVIF